MPRQPPVYRPPSVKAPQHNARGNEATNRQRKRAMHTGSKAWRLQRQRVLDRDGYACQWPEARKGAQRYVDAARRPRGICGQYGNQVDHKNNNAEEIVGDEELWVLCDHHHSSKTRKEQNANRTVQQGRADAD